ncbi:MAG: hypothetical protein MUF43_03675 [Flavobacterium sp.]|jgi:hypothetical protein|nr:hypothetical protein [Flavobacterium sp.]MCU0470241.1 hypothetical protein [Arcicella sp.]
MKTINRTKIDFKIKSVQIAISSLEKEISEIHQHTFEYPAYKINQVEALKEVETMLRNIKTLGTHDPQVLRKINGETFEQSLFS